MTYSFLIYMNMKLHELNYIYYESKISTNYVATYETQWRSEKNFREGWGIVYIKYTNELYLRESM